MEKRHEIRIVTENTALFNDIKKVGEANKRGPAKEAELRLEQDFIQRKKKK